MSGAQNKNSATGDYVGQEAAAAAVDIIDKFNAGDIDAVREAHAPGAVLVDEFPPFRWSGENSVESWLADLAEHQAAERIRDGRVEYAAPIRVENDGENCYVAFPTIFRFTQDAKAMSVAGTNTFVMTRVDDEWKIAASAYAAPAPKPEPTRRGETVPQ